MAGILTMTDLPRDLREWNRVFAPLNQALQRVQVAGETAVVADFDGKMTIKVDGTLIASDYSLNLISGSKINLSGVAGSGVVDVTIALQALVDADIPPEIARDSEVTAAANAAQSAAEATAAAALTAHEAAANPHPTYTTDAEAGVIAAAAVTAHEGASNPHPTYLTQTEGDGLYQPVAAALSRIYTGNGSPETVVTAGVGSLFLRQDGGANTTLYIKESGAGNTGWIAK